MEAQHLFDHLLLCVGAQKAGTSWLHSVLSTSDDITFGRRKELHYFDGAHGINDQLSTSILGRIAWQFGISQEQLAEKIRGSEDQWKTLVSSILDDDWYRAQFSNVRKYCADFTPEYALLDENGFEHARRIAHSVRVIFVMRDPIERTLSAFRYFHQNRKIDIRAMSNDEIKSRLQRDMFAGRSDYLPTVRNLNACFSESEVLYLFYEDMMADKAGTIDRICRFLDIETPTLQSEALEERVNASLSEDFDSEIYSFLEGQYRAQIPDLASLLGPLPSSWGFS